MDSKPEEWDTITEPGRVAIETQENYERAIGEHGEIIVRAMIAHARAVPDDAPAVWAALHALNTGNAEQEPTQCQSR
jgi:hypothetical protein